MRWCECWMHRRARAQGQRRSVGTEVARESTVLGEVVRRLGMGQGSRDGMNQWQWWHDVGMWQEAEDVARGLCTTTMITGRRCEGRHGEGWAATMRAVGRAVAWLSVVWQAQG